MKILKNSLKSKISKIHSDFINSNLFRVFLSGLLAFTNLVLIFKKQLSVQDFVLTGEEIVVSRDSLT